MKINKKEKIIISFIVLVLVILNYSLINNFLKKEFKDKNFREEIIVIRIIDGDTIESSIGTIRLLGINTPEKGELGYEEAKEYLTKRISNKTLIMEYGSEIQDKYGRTLGYLFYEDENINLELIEKGFANPYFPSGEDKYYETFVLAWNNCINSNINLCEKSLDYCAECIYLKNFDYQSGLVLFKNICNVDCDLNNWKLQHEGRSHIFLDFEIKTLEEKEIEFQAWDLSGDTLFLRDSKNKLVLWERY